MARDIEQSSVIQTLPNEVPLFPLPDHVFLPSIQAPYRVFEPRYRALVDALLERERLGWTRPLEQTVLGKVSSQQSAARLC